MRVRPWSELEKQLFSPKQIAAARTEAKRGILVEFFRDVSGRAWVVLVRGPKGTNVHNNGKTIASARRRVRAVVVRRRCPRAQRRAIATRSSTSFAQAVR